MLEPSTSIVVAYRLTEADVRAYCSAGLAGRCWRSCRGREVALAVMVALGGFLVGACYHARGARGAGIALGVTLAVVAALALAREVRFERRACRLGRQMGLPRELRLVVSAEGIADQAGPEGDDPARTFAWSEVVRVSRVDHLTVIRLRPARAAVIVPDSAFATAEQRVAFEQGVRTWRASAHSRDD